jgi:hypothetical protein
MQHFYTRPITIIGFPLITITINGTYETDGGGMTQEVLTVNGTYQINNSLGNFTWNNMTVNGTYIHNYNGGTISESISWGDNSLCLIKGVTNNNGFPDLPPDLRFVEIDCISLSDDIAFDFDYDNAFEHLTITNTNSKYVRFFARLLTEHISLKEISP